MFLLSLLPEIEPMTNVQICSFRRRVLQLIDDIMNPNPYLQLPLQSNYQDTTTSSLISSNSASQSFLPSNNPMLEEQNNDTNNSFYQIVSEAMNTNTTE